MQAFMQPPALTITALSMPEGHPSTDAVGKAGQADEAAKHPAALYYGHTKHSGMNFIASFGFAQAESRQVWPGRSHGPKLQLAQQWRRHFT
jgi:hypothetical protein